MIFRIILNLILFFAIYAQASEVYVIKNIKISASNKSASIARNEAIEEGQLKAFRGLVKLHYPDAQSKISQINKDDILSLVEGFELSEERRSATNYYAKLKVKFSRPHIDKLMQDLGASFSGAIKTPSVEEVTELSQPTPINTIPEKVTQKNFTTLVIPVFINKDKEYWFDDDNPWLDTWQKKNLDAKFILPVVDLEDLALINKNIIHKNVIDLTSLFKKYGVNNIALYTVEDRQQGQDHHIVSKVNYINKYLYSWQAYHFADGTGLDLSQLLNKSYNDIQNFNFNSDLDACCSIIDDLATVEPQTIMINFQVAKISDWLSLEQIIKRINYISNMQLERVTLNNYYFSLTFNISIDGLKNLFSKYGFDLTEQDKEFSLVKTEPAEINPPSNSQDNFYEE